MTHLTMVSNNNKPNINYLFSFSPLFMLIIFFLLNLETKKTLSVLFFSFSFIYQYFNILKIKHLTGPIIRHSHHSFSISRDRQVQNHISMPSESTHTLICPCIPHLRRKRKRKGEKRIRNYFLKLLFPTPPPLP